MSTAGAALLEQLADRQVQQSLSDAQMARAAYDAGEISWNDLVDVTSLLLVQATPEWRSVPEDQAPAGPRQCSACGVEIEPRYRKCDSCLR